MAYQKRGNSTESSEEAVGLPRLQSVEKLEDRARNVLLHQLGQGAKSTGQLRKILEQREIPTEVAEAALLRFTEVGLIDDLAFAETIISSRRTHKGSSRAVIKRELSEKGVDQSLVEEALSSITAEDEVESANELALKKFGQMQHLDKTVRDRRLAGVLARKGYPSSIVFAAIRNAEANYIGRD